MKILRLLVILSLLETTTAAFAAAAPAATQTTNITVKDNQIFIPCQFDAFKTDCMLDSGSGTSAVSSDLFEDYKPVGRIKYNGGTGTSIVVDKITIREFTIGQTRFKDWTVERLPTVNGFVNMVGLDVFSKAPVLFDFKNRQIILNAPKDEASSAFIMRLGIILLPVKIGEQPLLAAWDTGASLCIVNQDYVAKNPSEFAYVHEARVTDSTATNMTIKIYLVKNLVIGAVTLKDVRVAAMDFSGMKAVHPNFPDFVLGYNVMIEHSWYFDIAHSQWKFD